MCPNLCRCNSEMTRISCSGVTITESYLSTLVIPDSVKELHLYNNALKKISAISMRPFRNIGKLGKNFYLISLLVGYFEDGFIWCLFGLWQKGFE